jgi:hypothetical protein
MPPILFGESWVRLAAPVSAHRRLEDPTAPCSEHESGQASRGWTIMIRQVLGSPPRREGAGIEAPLRLRVRRFSRGDGGGTFE